MRVVQYPRREPFQLLNADRVASAHPHVAHHDRADTGGGLWALGVHVDGDQGRVQIRNLCSARLRCSICGRAISRVRPSSRSIPFRPQTVASAPMADVGSFHEMMGEPPLTLEAALEARRERTIFRHDFVALRNRCGGPSLIGAHRAHRELLITQTGCADRWIRITQDHNRSTHCRRVTPLMMANIWRLDATQQIPIFATVVASCGSCSWPPVRQARQTLPDNSSWRLTGRSRCGHLGAR